MSETINQPVDEHDEHDEHDGPATRHDPDEGDTGDGRETGKGGVISPITDERPGGKG